MANTSQKLHNAKNKKNDEFYTQFNDIQNEMNAYVEYNPNVFRNKTILLPCDDPEWSNFTKFFAQNFERFGLKKLISTSYAYESKKISEPYQLSLFESESPKYDKHKTKIKGKIFVLDKDNNKSGKIDINDLEWNYLEGDGDFRSDEVKKLRDESDIVITNPPFSLFREFVAWIFEKKKDFIIIGGMNAITYKEIFKLIKENKMWLGNGFNNGNAFFKVVGDGNQYAQGIYDFKTGLVKFRNCCWYTNIELGKRHQILKLMTMQDNLKYSKHKDIRENGYPLYDNYDAIEVSFTDAIPSDYNGEMGVPISFLNKYNPSQFKIVALGNSRENFTPNKDYLNPKKILKNGDIVNGGAINCVLTLSTKEKPTGMVYYTSDNSDYLIPPFARIIIERRNDFNENIIEN